MNSTAIDSTSLNSLHDPQLGSLFEQTQAKWLEGDWKSLSQFSIESIESLPDRARIALFVAAAHHQLDQRAEAHRWSRQALSWGSEKTALIHILIAGIYNSLARHAALQDDKERTLFLFGEAVALPGITRNSNCTDSRVLRELVRIGKINVGADILSTRIQELNISNPSEPWVKSQISILQTQIELLQSELVTAQRRGQLQARAEHREETPLSLAVANECWLIELRDQAMSQLGQDLWVLEKTSYKRGGFFVEFGATNGILLSNTYLLEKEFGWNGICAEPNPHFFKELQGNRLCDLSTACIGATTGEQVEFIFADVYGGMSKDAASDQHALKRQAFCDAGETAILTTISLHDFLIARNAPRTIDYLSIDTEGSELSILETFPFQQWDIRLLTVEHNFTEQREKIRKLLEPFGYRCQEVDFDDWYYK